MIFVTGEKAMSLLVGFFLTLILERERKRNIHWLSSTLAPTGDWTATRACAHQTHHFWCTGRCSSHLSHTSRTYNLHLYQQLSLMCFMTVKLLVGSTIFFVILKQVGGMCAFMHMCVHVCLGYLNACACVFEFLYVCTSTRALWSRVCVHCVGLFLRAVSSSGNVLSRGLLPYHFLC